MFAVLAVTTSIRRDVCPPGPVAAGYLSVAMNVRQARGGKASVALPRSVVSRTRTRADLPTSMQVLAGPLEWLDFRQAVSLRCIFPRTNL